MSLFDELTTLNKNIRYDFFMAVLGIALFYFIYVNDRIYDNPVSKAILLIASGALITYGFMEMRVNYKKDMAWQTFIRKNLEKEIIEKQKKKK